MSRIASLAVYCGSRPGTGDAYVALARELGSRVAAAGMTLVYGGGRVGLMGVVADAALAGGGRVVGVIPDFLCRTEIAHDGLDERIVVASLHARKQRMFDLADAFVVLPGGLGTLDEMVEVATWKLLGLHDKPVMLLDAAYWRPLLDLVDHFVAEGFLAPSGRRLIEAVADVDALFDALRKFGRGGPAAPSERL